MSATQPPPEPHRVRRGPAGGRPRNPKIDEAALAAARELLVEEGWAGTTMRTIAERAGVGRPALYRRWSSRAHLVLDALFSWTFEQSAIGEARDVEQWVRNAERDSLELFTRPEVRAALPGLLAELGPDEAIRETLWRTFNVPAADTLARLLREAGTTSAEPGLDGQAALVLVAGAALYLRLVVPDEDAAALEGRLSDLLLHGLARDQRS